MKQLWDSPIDRILWILVAYALLTDEVMVFCRPLPFLQFNVLWITSNEQEEDCLLIRAVTAASASGLWWLLSGPEGGGTETPQQLYLSDRPPFLQFVLTIPSLRSIVSVYLIGLFLNTLKQQPTKGTHVACGREQSRWKGGRLDY